MPIVNFINQNVKIEVEKGTTILESARKAGVIVESPCDGIGVCAKCKVKIAPEDYEKIHYLDENEKLSQKEKEEGFVLACQTVVYDSISVITDSTENQNKTLKILSKGMTISYDIDPWITKKYNGKETEIIADNQILGIEEGDTTALYYGLAIDIGTTTVVCSLIDMKTGNEVDSVSALNPQSLHAQDVLTRIKFASSEDGLKLMYDSIIDSFNEMIQTLCEKNHINKQNIYEAVYSGNTTMIHLAGNRNPEPLGKYPYTPNLYGGCYDLATDNGIDISEYGYVYYPPIISAYVGPDITSGVISTNLKNEKGNVLLIDIGTNGEMVISKSGNLSATSTAAGPAFEGMNITFGMRAGKGAIEYFDIDDNHNISIRTIEDAAPVGICGSGLFDIVGELVRTGIITKTGRFIRPNKLDDSDPLKLHLKQYKDKPAFEVADGIYLTISDVRQVQLAKGAVRSGVEALMKSQDLSSEKVDKVLIAGSFGYHLRTKSLVNITLVPKSFENKIEFAGNTSKTGGIAFLLNQNIKKETKKITDSIKVIELSTIDGYNDLFVKCLNF